MEHPKVDEVPHPLCAVMMNWHDALPRELRLFLHEHNMPEAQVNQVARVLRGGGRIEIMTADGKTHRLGPRR